MSAALKAAFQCWYVFCISSLSSGCFFFLPLIPEEDNHAPEIFISVPAEGEDLVIDVAEIKPFVRAEDPDGDPLVCEWAVDTDGSLGAGDPVSGGNGCKITLGPDPDYNGHDLYVFVSDPSNDYAERHWKMVIPSEEQ